MKKGINQWCFPVNVPVEERFDLARDLGFEGFEVAMGEIGESNPERESDYWQELALLAEQKGLELHSISTDLHWSYPLSSPDRELRGKGMEVGEAMIKAAAHVGAGAALIVPGVADPRTSYLETYRISQESIGRLGETAREYGVRLGVENVWNRFLQGPLEMRNFIEGISLPSVGVYLDIGNVMALGHPQHWIEVLGDHIVRVHVKDFATAVGNLEGFAYLLHGDVPWKEVISELRGIGYSSYLTPELNPPQAFTERMLAETSANLTAILKGEA